MLDKAESWLRNALDYRFADVRLLQQALTHRSAASDNNERLEFLGDAVLGQVVAEQLYHSFPKADEGQLSRLRASLVKREALADIARGLESVASELIARNQLEDGAVSVLKGEKRRQPCGATPPRFH